MQLNLDRFLPFASVGSVAYWGEEWKSPEWETIVQCYADSVQLNLLRALSVTGKRQGYWDIVFLRLYEGKGEWGIVNRSWFERKEVPHWHQLVTLVLKEVSEICYPPHAPIWLADYGYTQFQYLADLKEYWTDIGDEYYRPWPSSRVGYDLVTYDAIKQLSQETQADVEQLIQSAKLVLHLVKNGGSYDNYEQNDETEAERV